MLDAATVIHIGQRIESTQSLSGLSGERLAVRHEPLEKTRVDDFS